MKVDSLGHPAQRHGLDSIGLRRRRLFGQQAQTEDFVDVSPEGLTRPPGPPLERLGDVRLECHSGADHDGIIASRQLAGQTVERG